MPRNIYSGHDRLNITGTDSSIIVANGQGKYLVGVFCSQASNTPTLKVADSNGVIANTFTPVAGTFYQLPFQINGTLTVTVGGTVDATVFYGGD